MSDKLFRSILYLYAFCSDFFLVFSVDKLLFKANGLSITQIAIILSTWGGIQLLAEIPSGILADKWNRKYMLTLSGLFSFLCYFTWFLFPNFVGYIIGFSIFYALGIAFLSGTDQAYIYDYLAGRNQLQDYEKMYGLFRSIRLGSLAIAWLLGGYISDLYSFDIIVLLAAGSGFLTFILGLLLPKIPQTTPVANQNPFSFFKDSFLYAIQHPHILQVLVWAMIIGSSYKIIDEYYAVYYNWFGFSNTTLGILVFISALLGSLIGTFTYKLKNHLLRNMNYLSLVLTAIFLVSGTVKSLWVIPFFILLDPIMHVIGTIGDSVIQRNALEDRRSTIASTCSFLTNIFMFTGLFFGWIIDHYSVKEGYLFVGSLCLLYFFILPFLPRRAQSSQTVQT